MWGDEVGVTQTKQDGPWIDNYENGWWKHRCSLYYYFYFYVCSKCPVLKDYKCIMTLIKRFIINMHIYLYISLYTHKYAIFYNNVSLYRILCVQYYITYTLILKKIIKILTKANAGWLALSYSLILS